MNYFQYIKNNIHRQWTILSAGFLWLCIWATYNTDIGRIHNPDFPHSILDLLHGVRAFFPFIALVLAIGILVKKQKVNRALLKGPLGFLGVYALVGLFSSLLFSQNPSSALYWGTLYLSAIVVLLAIVTEPRAFQKTALVIWLTVSIGAVITLVLMVILFLQPGVFSFTSVMQFLHGQRPYEAIGAVSSKMDIFDTPGTRPTGLGRYAGLAALAMFVNFWHPKKKIRILFYVLFAIFCPIIIFTRARTSIIAFFVALFFVALCKAKSKFRFSTVVASVLLLLCVTNFYEFSQLYLTGEDLLQKPIQTVALTPPSGQSNPIVIENPAPKIKSPAPLPGPAPMVVDNAPAPAPTLLPQITPPPVEVSSQKSLSPTTITLSGRTTGIWPEAWGLFLKSPLIGFGFQADRIFLQGQHTHNTLLQALIQSGVIGTLFFVLAFVLAWLFLPYLIKRFPTDMVLLQSVGILAYFTVRGITESSAFFGADYLFLVPVFAYLQCFWQQQSPRPTRSIQVLGNTIDMIELPEVIERMEAWITQEKTKPHWIVVTGMHGIMESQKNKDFQKMLNSADLFVPDGISLVWIAKLKGLRIKDRVSGADLMKEFLKIANKKGYSSFFYGDSRETLDALQNKLLKEFPNLKIVGSYDSHYKPLFSEEDKKVISMINEKKPDILWVGRGMPKQENWIYRYKDELNVPIVIGVGAAFKFLSGRVKRAPAWIGKLGFEWLWRLCSEPKATWKRVFLDAPRFVCLVLVDFIKNG